MNLAVRYLVALIAVLVTAVSAQAVSILDFGTAPPSASVFYVNAPPASDFSALDVNRVGDTVYLAGGSGSVLRLPAVVALPLAGDVPTQVTPTVFETPASPYSYGYIERVVRTTAGVRFSGVATTENGFNDPVSAVIWDADGHVLSSAIFGSSSGYDRLVADADLVLGWNAGRAAVGRIGESPMNLPSQGPDSHVASASAGGRILWGQDHGISVLWRTSSPEDLGSYQRSEFPLTSGVGTSLSLEYLFDDPAVGQIGIGTILREDGRWVGAWDLASGEFLRLIGPGYATDAMLAEGAIVLSIVPDLLSSQATLFSPYFTTLESDATLQHGAFQDDNPNTVFQVYPGALFEGSVGFVGIESPNFLHRDEPRKFAVWRLEQIPEPSAMMLLACAMASVTALRRRVRSRSC